MLTYGDKMVKGRSKRQENGNAFFPQWVWENLKIPIGEEFEFEVEEKTKGIFVAFWKNKKET
jgi:hypothetical protein